MRIFHKELKEHEVTDKYVCDLCHKDIPILDMYDVNEVEVSHKVGKHYPDDWWGHELDLDICPACWCNVILPFLREKSMTRKYNEY